MPSLLRSLGRHQKSIPNAKPTRKMTPNPSSPVKSFHPPATKEAIAYGQALRLRRICTEDSDFVEATTKLEADLVKRGYDPEKIRRDIGRAAAKDRQTLRRYNEKTRDTRIPLVLTYDNRLPRVQEVLENKGPVDEVLKF